MTQAESVMIDLLRASLTGSPFENRNPAVDWNAVRECAELQTVAGLIAKQVPLEAGTQWQEIARQHLAYFSLYLVAQKELAGIFENAGIPMVILKGCAAAKYYPAPECRSMGDIDFIVPQDRFQEACTLMKKYGYADDKEARDEQQEQGGQPRHVSFRKDLFTYELHHHFSYTDLNIEPYVIDGLTNREKSQIYSFDFPMLPRLANGLVLLAHMRDHLKSGLGLRQVIDWMMYVNGELDDVFWNKEFCAAAESVGLDTLAKTAARMCQLYFSLSERFTWCVDADERVCRRLMELLLVSGNFGVKQGSGSSIEAVSTTFQKNGFFRQLQLAGERNWKAYQRNSRLKPLCWAYQLGRYCSRGLHTGRGIKMLQDASRSKERYEVLKALEIADAE